MSKQKQTAPPALHPVTLRFADPRQEESLKATQFQGSYVATIAILLLQLPAHALMTNLSDSYLIITVIYVPLICMCAIGRILLDKLEDGSRSS